MHYFKFVYVELIKIKLGTRGLHPWNLVIQLSHSENGGETTIYTILPNRHSTISRLTSHFVE